MKINKKLIIVAAAILLAIFALTLFPPSPEKVKASHAHIDYQYSYILEADGKPALCFSELTDGQATIGEPSDDIMLAPPSQHLTDGFARMTLDGQWVKTSMLRPWGEGRLLVANPECLDSAILHMENINDSIDLYIAHLRRQLQKADSILQQRSRKMDYYLDVRDVTDDGYNTLATYAAETVRQREMASLALDVLDSLGTSHRLKFRLLQRFMLLPPDSIKGSNPIVLQLQTGNPHRRWYRLKPLHTERNADKEKAWSKHVSLFSHALPDSIETKMLESATRAKRPFSSYIGEMSNGQRNGHGIYRDLHGNLYDGFWVNGKREGFGCGIDSTGQVYVGEWKADRFRGERMTHRPERIYGIDIARYQHEYNGRVNGIGWSQMRLWSLGTRTKKQILGEVDYPISFCFIKSTQGTEIVSDYFRADYHAARAHGIRVGAYHFYSKKGNGMEQAHHFLKHSLFSSGDLPPVLDLEPSEAQIKEMGGEEKMFDNVRIWLNIVEEAVGVRPILYVNQMFINNHLSKQEDLKQNYLVWIARYGEFRPDMQLAFWQLAADGRVKGINRTVDVNVFNGFKDQWEEFCEQYCIK